MKQTASQILQEGRARVAKRWIQGDMWNTDPDGTPGYCAIGALWYQEKHGWAVGSNAEPYLQAHTALYQVLPEGVTLIAYNDDPHRTQADILALYDRALTLVTK